MSIALKDQAAIVGIGQTEFSKNSGRSELQLACEAVRAALADAGIAPVRSRRHDHLHDGHQRRDRGRARVSASATSPSSARTPYGGGAAIGVIQQAVMAIATGVAECVVVYRAFNERSGRRYSTGVSEALVTADAIHWSWYMPFGLLTPASWVAMYTQRYMHEYGCKGTDLAQVAVSARKHAVNNPAAFFHGMPLTVEEHQASKWIAEPLRLFDCCQESDGGCAQVIVSAKRAREMKAKGAVIRGVAQAAGADQENMTSFYRPSISYLPEMDLVAKQAYAMSGLRAERRRRRDHLRRLHAGGDVAARVVGILWSRRGEGFRAGRQPRGRRRTAVQHARRSALRGVHPRHERRERGRAADPRHVAESAGEERPCAGDRRSRRADEGDDPGETPVSPVNYEGEENA